MTETDWPQVPPNWSADEDVKALLYATDCPASSGEVYWEKIAKNSSNLTFPIETVRCHYLKMKLPTTTLDTNINSAYPLLHESSLFLFATFLTHKRKFGTTIEKNFYEKMDLLQFIDKLLTKRAVMFVGVWDRYLLSSGESGTGGWETVGTPAEKPPLTLANCLSYDEIKLSALLSVTSHTHFLNDGNRRNCGVYEPDREKIQDGGVIVGLIGPRLVKSDVMEHQDVVVTKTQNVKSKGYDNDGKGRTLPNLFATFYGCGGTSRSYGELKKVMTSSPDRYIVLNDGEFLDGVMLSRRLALSIDTLLIEANQRAKDEKTMAFVHVVGLGLGVWKICLDQNRIFMETFEKRLEFLADTLSNVSDVRFAYIDHKTCGKYGNGDVIPMENHPKGGIKVHVGKENPHLKLTGTDEGKLLVVSYAWDGNAFPGNEFWAGNLWTSSDPAAACSTQVTELHNAYVNPRVCAANLRVATLKGLVTFRQYQELHKND